MKKHFVITHQTEENGHLNVQDLLPASCKLITGVAVIATAKQAGQTVYVVEYLAFPQALINGLLTNEQIADLFYSYLRTRSDETESRAFFESGILLEIVRVLSSNIVYTCLDTDQQQQLSDNFINLFNDQFTDYLYNEMGLYNKGQEMSDLGFTDFIAQQTILFTYKHRDEIFKRTVKAYKQPEPYECGNISLLVNGNSFLLRDYVLTANRKVSHMSKEIIPFHEPLEVNSNIHTIFKSNKNSGDNMLTIRIYIEYESLSKKEKQLSNPNPEELTNEHE